MPLPLLWVGAAIGALALADEREKRLTLERERRLGPASSGRQRPLQASQQAPLQQAPLIVVPPSQWQTGLTRVKSHAGSLVCCHVYGVIEHTGIWLEEDCVVELHGSGLVRAVSEQRFLAGRTGSKIFVACNRQHQPLIASQVAQRAAKAIYQYRHYDVFDNNCHRFVWACISGEEQQLDGFGAFNQQLVRYFKQGIYWDEMRTVSRFGNIA